MSKLKEIAAYCAANIDGWDEKCELALLSIGNRMPIDYGFRNEIEDCVSDWADGAGYAIEFFDDIEVEDIILWTE